MAYYHYDGLKKSLSRADIKLIEQAISCIMEEPCNSDLMMDPYCGDDRLRLTLKKSNLHYEFRIAPYAGAPVDLIIDQAVNGFRKLKDKEKKQQGYPVKKKEDLMAIAYPWAITEVCPTKVSVKSYAANVAGAAMRTTTNAAAIQAAASTLTNAHTEQMKNLITPSSDPLHEVTSKPKKKPKDYRAQLQAELDEWLH